MTTSNPHRRIVGVDVARGAALLAMVAYHVAWDLHAFGFSAVDPGRSPPWHAFGQAIASVFLFLSGLSLVLAQARGESAVRALRRIAILTSAAALVTAVTAVATPGQTILFGILHCIALGNMLALPLLEAPIWVVLSLAAVAFAIPAVAPDGAPAWLWWLGLSRQIPDTLDVRPLLPWLGVVLLGLAFGRGGVLSRLPRAAGMRGRLGRAVATAGRHTLLIYLLHQPLLFAAFTAVAQVWPSQQESPAAQQAFVPECEQACIAKDTDPERCLALCRCVQTRLVTDPAAIGRTDALTVYALSCVVPRP